MFYQQSMGTVNVFILNKGLKLTVFFFLKCQTPGYECILIGEVRKNVLL